MKLPIKITLLSLLSLTIVGCAEFSNPGSYGGGYGSGGYNDPYYDYDRDEYYRERERDRIRDEQKDLDRERRKLDRERDELERQRERASRPPPPPPPPVERCPSGFSPSERKCSKEERKRGCKDMRLPGGLGCVSR